MSDPENDAGAPLEAPPVQFQPFYAGLRAGDGLDIAAEADPTVGVARVRLHEGGGLAFDDGQLRVEADAVAKPAADMAGPGLRATSAGTDARLAVRAGEGLALRDAPSGASGAVEGSPAQDVALDTQAAAAALAGQGLQARSEGDHGKLDVHVGEGLAVGSDGAVRLSGDLGGTLGRLAHLSIGDDLSSAAGSGVLFGGTDPESAPAAVMLASAPEFPVTVGAPSEAEEGGDGPAREHASTLRLAPADAFVTGQGAAAGGAMPRIVSLPGIPFAVVFGDTNPVPHGTLAMGVEAGSFVVLAYDGREGGTGSWVRQLVVEPRFPAP